MAFDEKLASRVRAMLEGSPGITEKRMFGGLAFLRHGHMFVGISGSKLMARVGKEHHAASLARAHVRPMDFTGRPMDGYVYVEPAGLAKDVDLEFWVRHCEGFVGALPPKAAPASAPKAAPASAPKAAPASAPKAAPTSAPKAKRPGNR